MHSRFYSASPDPVVREPTSKERGGRIEIGEAK